MRFLLATVLFSSIGCLGAKAGYKMVELEQNWAGVEAAQASEFAVYEYTLAKEYRAKAWEEAGYNEYEAAELLTDKADGFGQTAERLAKEEREAQRLLEEMNQDEDLLPDQMQPEEESSGTGVMPEEDAPGFPESSQDDEVLEDWAE